ncbi:MAG: potassium channel family protein [Leifsonia sp.]
MTADTWRRLSEWPLTAAAVVFLITYSIEVIDDVPDSRALVFDVIIWAVWALFVVDFVVSLILAERRVRWLGRNLHQVAILALPMLRPLRLIRLLSVVGIAHRLTGRRLRGRILAYGISSFVVVVYAGALAALDAEQNVRGASITNIGQALWWAVSTITGTGFGDVVPVTLVGKLVGVGLMIGGIAIVGLVAAAFASWMIEQVGARVAEQAEETETETQSGDEAWAW